MRRNVEHLVRKEQAAFDALLKNPDFQRWLREAWETCRKSSRQEREAQPRQCCGEQGKCEDCRKDEAPMPKTEHTHTSACDNPSNCPTGNAYAKAAPMQKSGHHPKCHTVLMAGKDAWPACTCATIAKMHPDDQKTGINTVRDAAGNPRQPQNVYACCRAPATGEHEPCCPNHTAPATPRCTCTHSTAIDYHDKACPMFPAWVQRKYENAAKNAPQPKAPPSGKRWRRWSGPNL